jgi:predicted secreted protein
LKKQSRAGLAASVIVMLGAVAPAAHAVTPQAEGPGYAASLLSGQSVTIKLKPGNSGSSGYHWEVAHKPAKKVLRLQVQHTVRGGKQQVFLYKALSPGGATLKLKYVPPGRHAKPVKTYRLQVAVNGREPRLDCSASGRPSSEIARDGTAVVFKVPRTLYAVEVDITRKIAYDAFYGCELAQDRAYRLGGVVDLLKAQDFTNIRLNGNSVGYLRAEHCPYDQFRGCTVPSRYVESQDLHTGSTLRRILVGHAFPVPDFGNTVSELFVSPTGGLAWIEESRDDEGRADNLVLRSDAPPAQAGSVVEDREVLDSGELVDPASLQYDGTDVTWTRDGAQQSAPLR